MQYSKWQPQLKGCQSSHLTFSNLLAVFLSRPLDNNRHAILSMDWDESLIADEYSVIVIVSCKTIYLAQSSKFLMQSLSTEYRNMRAIATLATDRRKGADHEFVQQTANN